MESPHDAAIIALTAAPSDHRIEPSPNKEMCQNSQEGLANPSSQLSPKPLSPSSHLETDSVKRVRKLKKKKCLKKAKGNEQPEISESELDAEQPAPRPARKYRPHRRSSGTSASPPTPEEKNENEAMVVTEVSKAQPQRTKLATPPKNEAHSDSSELEMVELPPPVPTDFVNLDSSDPDEMPEKKAKKSTKELTKKSTKESAKESTTAYSKDHAITDPQNLACNEVTSTSEIDTSSTVKARERYVSGLDCDFLSNLNIL